MKDKTIENYICIGMALGMSLGVCCGSIIDLITYNSGHYIVFGLPIGMVIGISLSIACFYASKDKKKSKL